MKKLLVKIAISAALISSFFTSSIAQESKKTNIVLILVDDISWNCFSCYGSNNFKTPYIDKLGESGIRFEHCYSQPNCTPSRVKLMTGMYNFRNYISFGQLKKGERTFGNVAKDAGYATCIAGKWQLGRLSEDPDMIKKFGFDSYCLHSTGDVGSRYWSPNYVQDGKKHLDVGAYGPDIYSDYICNFIIKNKDKPFFAYYPMVLMHSPYVPTPDSSDEMKKEHFATTEKIIEASKVENDKIRNMSPKEQKKYKASKKNRKEPTIAERKKGTKTNYELSLEEVAWENDKVVGYPAASVRDRQGAFADMALYMDKIVKKIMDTLSRENLLENTIVIFTADNGTGHEIYSDFLNQKVLGGKGTMKDCGDRVPLIVYWKDHTKEGTVSKSLVDFCDFYPTVAEIMKEDISEEKFVDGQSFFDTIKGCAKPADERSFVISHWTAYKGNKKGERFVRNRDYKLYEDGRFYKVSDDMFEKNPLDKSYAPEDYTKLSEVINSLPPLPKDASAAARKNAVLYKEWDWKSRLGKSYK